MAVSQIEEKILGRLAKLTEPSNPLLSASLYQVLGLSILLSRKLYRARKLRKLDLTRDTKSLQLYHHIIWLAREGLSITEAYILPYCQNGDYGPECRVMAAKLRASLYHVFCLFHNHPPISLLSGRSGTSISPPSKTNTPKNTGNAADSPTKTSPKESGSRRRAGKAPLRDPVPSIQSDASFVTNPYVGTATQTPPPGLAILPPEGARRTPSRPPGLAPINIPAAQSAASFLLPPLNFVPMAKEHFEAAQQLSDSLLPVTHALRLSVALEHSAFLWDCAKEHDRSRLLARKTIKEVYSSSDGLDDDEFADASVLVQALGGMVKRGSNESTPQQRSSQAGSPTPRVHPRTAPPLNIDRTIAVSPPSARGQPAQQSQQRRAPAPTQIPRSVMRSPERLSTVPEAEVEGSEAAPASTVGAFSPPVSRLSSRSQANRASSVTSAASDKASKRKLVEQAEEQVRQRQRSTASASASGGSRRGSGSGGSAAHSRQQTPTEGYSIRASASTPRTSPPPTMTKTTPNHSPTIPHPAPPPLPKEYLRALQEEAVTEGRRVEENERREAILRTLQILGAVERGLYVPDESPKRSGRDGGSNTRRGKQR
ncbi:unnamed protein product [Cercospora beticola]|nr:unnamed protein product [Cercospora beticola]